MVFGWGKKKAKEEESEPIVRKGKDIQVSDIKSILEDIQSLRTKTIIAQVKSFRKKIETQLNDILKITKDLERDSLNVKDIDKHLEILVVRGKKQVVEVIKKEAAEKLPEINSYDDVESLNILTKQILKRIGDVLGRQSRVIHIFAKKYAAKLKIHLSILNSDRDEIQSLFDKHTKMNEDIDIILEKIQAHKQSNKIILETKTRISDLKKSTKNLEKDEEKIKQKISDLKSGDNYSQYLDTKKKLDSLSSNKQEIKNLIGIQFTKISRPLGRYEYASSLEKPQKILLKNLVNNPYDVLTVQNKDLIIKILSAVRKGVEGGSISVKDSTKSLSSIDETIELLDDFISKIQQYEQTKNDLEKDLEVFNTNDLKQHEIHLTKISNDRSDANSKVQKLEGEISEIKQKLPQIIIDMEIKLQKVSSTKFHISN